MRDDTPPPRADDPPLGAPRARRGSGRRIAGLVLGLIAAVCAAGLVFIGQGPGLRWALQRAELASGGRLQLQDVEGSLWRGVTIARLVWDDPAGDRIEADDVAARWALAPLLRREVRLPRLAARTLRIDLRSSDAPPAMPGTLALPITFTLDDASIGALSIGREAGERVEIEALRMSARYRDGRYEVQRLGLSSPWGTLEGAGRLDDAAPFPLAAELRIVGRADGLPDALPIRATLSGSLDGIDARAEAELRAATLTVSAPLRPFAEVPLGALAVSVRGLDPRRFAPGAPAALLDATGTIDAPGARTRGQLAVVNRLPGPVSGGRLPVTSASARFEASAQGLRLEDLAADLGAGGSVGGTLRVGWSEADARRDPLGRMDLDLAIRRLDVSRLWAGAVATRLDGTVRAERGELRVDLADRGVLLDGGLGAKARMVIETDRLRIREGELRARDGTLTVAGSIGFGGEGRFDLRGRASRFDPGRWISSGGTPGDPPLRGRLDGEWTAEGAARPVLHARVGLTLADSRLAGLPLAGSVRAALTGPPAEPRDARPDGPAGGASAGRAERRAGSLPLARLHDVALRLALGATRLDAQGALGHDGDRLAFTLEARSLTELDPRLAGRLGATGELRDRLDAPGLAVQWVGDGLQPPGRGPVGAAPWRIDALRGSAEVSDLRDGRLALQARAEGLRLGQVMVDALTASVRGSAAEHTVRMTGTGRGQRLELAGDGALEDGGGGPRWRGRIATLETGGAVQIALRQPLNVVAQAGSVILEGLDASLFGGRLTLARAGWDDGRGMLRGEIADLSIDRIIETVRALQPSAIGAELARTNGFRVGAAFDLTGSGPEDLTGRLDFDSVSTLVQARSRGRLKADAGALSGSLHLELPSLAFARAAVGDDWRVDGSVSFDGDVSGRVMAPRLAGALNGKGLRLEQQLLGWRLTDGVLAARFDGDRLTVDALRFASSGGRVSMEGTIALPEQLGTTLDLGRGEFALRAERLPLAIGPGQRVVLSGATTIRIERDTMRWSGRVVADEGLLELRDLDSPTTPEDLVIVDRRKAPAPGADDRGARGRGRPSQVKVMADLELDLGQRFRVSGSGVDGWLAGSIRLAGALPDAPRATGTVTLRDGKYRAYGQELVIDRGRIVFNGPLDNPILDIVAVRKERLVEAGVALSGTAQAPRVRLVSTPNLPDAEKLSWLVLGVGLDEAGSASQTAALQAAAATFTGRDGGSADPGGFARSIGLDMLGIRGATSTTAPSALPGTNTATGLPAIPGGVGRDSVGAATQQNVVAVGKRLSSRLYVSYEQGLRGVWNLLKIQYDLTRQLSIRALTGSESAIDLLFFRSFD